MAHFLKKRLLTNKLILKSTKMSSSSHHSLISILGELLLMMMMMLLMLSLIERIPANMNYLFLEIVSLPTCGVQLSTPAVDINTIMYD